MLSSIICIVIGHRSVVIAVKLHVFVTQLKIVPGMIQKQSLYLIGLVILIKSLGVGCLKLDNCSYHYYSFNHFYGFHLHCISHYQDPRHAFYRLLLTV